MWATINEMAPGRFFVTVSALSAEDPDRTGGVETGEATSIEQAREIRERLIARFTDKLHARGHRVVEVKSD